MPLPTNDPVAFKGVPSLGGNKKMALTVTFTQKQVEAMFQRHDALRAQGSSQCPLEIDFDDNKIYIGEIATPFTRVKEHGAREICQRSPTVSKPLAGITLAGNVIGKLNIQRDYDQDLADNIRKLTEAEASKRKERHIVRLDSPPVISNVKRSRPGSGTSSLAKKAMANRIVHTQTASGRTSTSSTPTSRSVAPKTSNGPQAPPDSSTRSALSNSSIRSGTSIPQPIIPELDLTSLRSHMVHYLAFEPRTTQDVLFKVGGQNPSSETVREIEETLTRVAEEVRRPKNAPGPVSWQLLPRSWEEVRPYEYGSLSDADRKKLARKGRLSLGGTVDMTDPLLDHFRSDVDPSVTSSSMKDKGKEKPSAPRPLVKTSDFKGGMFPKERKPVTKGGGVASGGVAKKKAAVAKSKAKKEQEDEVEVKARKVVAALDDVKGKGKASTGISAFGSGIATNKLGPVDEEKEEDAIPLSAKSRQLPATSKKDDPHLKSRRLQDQQPTKHKFVDGDGSSEIEDGELPANPVKKRKVIAELNKPGPVASDKNKTSTNKTSKEQGSAKDESGSLKSLAERNSAPRASNAGSSSKASGLPGSKALRLEKEKERERQERETLEIERLKDREREKRRSGGKRARRATPAFSSDEDEEVEVKSIAPSRSTNAKASAPSATPKSSMPASKPGRAPSPVLPTDKEGLRRHYNSCYTRYMGVTFKLHEQRTKIEAALQIDGDSVSTDDADLMDTEQLIELRAEHERLRDELERIQRAHAMVF